MLEARPLALMVRIDVFEERHRTVAVASWLDPSGRVATAENCAVDPGAIVDGPEIFSPTMTGDGTTGVLDDLPQADSAAAVARIAARKQTEALPFMLTSRTVGLERRRESGHRWDSRMTNAARPSSEHIDHLRLMIILWRRCWMRSIGNG
jgi:hypothetical protein